MEIRLQSFEASGLIKPGSSSPTGGWGPLNTHTMIGEVITSDYWNKSTPIDKIKLVDFTISQFKSPIRYFNSISEIAAGLDYDKKPKYYDPKKQPVIRGAFPAAAPLKALEDLQNVASAKLLASKIGMNMVVTVNGSARYFKYYPGKMMLEFRGIKESEFTSISKQKELQAECDKLNAKARKTFDALMVLSKLPLDADQQRKFVDAVAIYNQSVIDIKNMDGVSVQVKKFNTAGVGSIGVVPVIVWAVIAIIALGTVYIVTNTWDKVKTKQMTFDAQTNNVLLMTQAALLKQQGKISQESYDKIMRSAQNNIDTNNKNLTTAANADNKSTLDKLTTLAAVAAGGFILYKLI